MAHVVCCAIAFLWARLCWMSQLVHTAWIIGTFAVACLQGAGYYNHWLGRRYARALERKWGDVEVIVDLITALPLRLSELIKEAEQNSNTDATTAKNKSI